MDSNCNNFVYLDGNVGTHDGVDGDISRRIGLARTVFQMLKKVWSSTDISNTTKMKVYATMVLSVLLYNSETWTLKQTQENRLRVFEMSCLRRIAGVTRRDRIRNKEVCDRVGLLQDIANRIQQQRMQYFGHVQRMDHTRYPKLALHGYVHGTRRPKKRWIDTVKDDCRQRNVTLAFIKQQRWLNIVRHEGAWWSCVWGHPRCHGNKSSQINAPYPINGNGPPFRRSAIPDSEAKKSYIRVQ